MMKILSPCPKLLVRSSAIVFFFFVVFMLFPFQYGCNTDKKHCALAPRPEVVKDLKLNWKGKTKVLEVEEGDDDDDEEARRERAKHFPRMI